MSTKRKCVFFGRTVVLKYMGQNGYGRINGGYIKNEFVRNNKWPRTASVVKVSKKLTARLFLPSILDNRIY